MKLCIYCLSEILSVLLLLTDLYIQLLEVSYPQANLISIHNSPVSFKSDFIYLSVHLPFKISVVEVFHSLRDQKTN